MDDKLITKTAKFNSLKNCMYKLRIVISPYHYLYLDLLEAN